MGTSEQNDQIKSIFQMLFEMASGNLAFRLEIDHNDSLGQISETLNKVAYDLEQIMLKEGYPNPHQTFNRIVQNCFLLTQNYEIANFTPGTPTSLGYNPADLVQQNFDKLIAKKSAEDWLFIKDQISSDAYFYSTMQLIFLSRNNKLVPAYCAVTRLLRSEHILVSWINSTVHEFSNEKYIQADNRAQDLEIVQKLYDYILEHLDEPLPTLQQLAVTFKTNDYKLKQGFRDLFNTSIYHFYHESRLKRAHAMIVETDIPLKEVALKSGFNSYANFYKAFKSKFGCSPIDLNRQPGKTV